MIFFYLNLSSFWKLIQWYFVLRWSNFFTYIVNVKYIYF